MKFRFFLLWFFFALIFCLGYENTPTQAYALQITPVPNSPYFQSSTISQPDGIFVEKDVINGPSQPPVGYTEQAADLDVIRPSGASSTAVLDVPAYTWVFGCSSVSGAMIAAYYDQNGYANMYSGPTNDGVMPDSDTVWSTWNDGYSIYPNNPLIASHLGLDGRTEYGSIDDYWVQYDSSTDDPYITALRTKHTWGDAIGDYMKTSQSAYGYNDGSTVFYNFTSSGAQLTCSAMETYGINSMDGTYGRKLFYEARGFTVTDCYNQKTDNNGGNFTFALYKSEIDAGRPVLINLYGHSIVGVGYDDSSNTVYLNNTWYDNTYSMTWGGTYYGMDMLSVSIVNLAESDPPDAFSKSSPSDTATGVSITPTLSWSTSTGAANYEYCYDTSDDDACSNWTSTGTTASAVLNGLDYSTTYYWQVRAGNVYSTTYADGVSTDYAQFTTEAMPLPGSFTKSTPSDGASSQSITPTLTWGNSSNAVSYEYCYDTSDDDACSVWTNVGSAASSALSSLSYDTTYYWQVRAVNTTGITYANGSSAAYNSFATLGAPASFSKSAPADGASNQEINPTLSWDESTDAVSYEICIDTTDDNACSGWQDAGEDTNLPLDVLDYSTTYYWQVRASNDAGTTYADGSETAYASFTTLPLAIPVAFEKSTPVSGATNQTTSPTLSWNSSSGTTNYEYCLAAGSGDDCTDWVSVGTATTTIVTGLESNTTYYWQVRASNPAGTTYAGSGSTVYWSFTTIEDLSPAAFSKISPADGEDGQTSAPVLQWESSSRATSYEYCYDSTDDGSCYSWNNVGTAVQVTLSSLSQGTTYYWQVRAVNSYAVVYADGASSVSWSFTIVDDLATPENVEADDGVDYDQVCVNWDPVGEYRFRISRNDPESSSNSLSVLTDDLLNAPVYCDTSAKHNAIYYYYVQTCLDENTCSIDSASDSGYLKDYQIFIPGLIR